MMCFKSQNTMKQYGCNKKKNHCILNIWKHEAENKINIDLWKP